MKDLLIYAAVVFVSACAGTCVGTALSVRSPKKRIQKVEDNFLELTGIVIQIIELGVSSEARNHAGDSDGIVGSADGTAGENRVSNPQVG